MSPFDRDPALEGDIVDTKAWVTSIHGDKAEVMFIAGNLPRNWMGFGVIERGWRFTLPSGETGIVTDHWEQFAIHVEIKSASGFPKMLKMLKRRRKARVEGIRIERFAENVIPMEAA